jgi:peptidoglycan/LPS O-acetylase OafA/YrhL
MKSLDVLRGLSGLVVFISHYFQIYWLSVSGRNFFVNFWVNISSYAVTSFFVLSGYLITLSLKSNLDRNSKINANEYITKRGFRIFPPLVLSILVTWVIYKIILFFNLFGSETYLDHFDQIPFGRSRFNFDFNSAIWTLVQTYAFGPGFYLEANGPLWSLSYEVGFYIIILGVALVGLNFKNYLDLILGSVIILFITASAIYYRKWLFFFYLSLWLMGVLVFFIMNWRKNKSVTLSLLFIIGVLANLSFFKGAYRFNEFIFAIIISIYICTHKKLDDFFNSSRLAHKVATLSRSTYSIYILHFPVMLLGYSLFHHYYYNFFEFYVCATLGFSLITYLLIDWSAQFFEDRKKLEKLFRIT